MRWVGCFGRGMESVGEESRMYRVNDEGKIRRVFQIQNTHVRALHKSDE